VTSAGRSCDGWRRRIGQSSSNTCTKHQNGPDEFLHFSLPDFAVVQGSDTEKSMTNGKDSSGKYVWMDVFVKRDGKWVAVRSESTIVK